MLIEIFVATRMFLDNSGKMTCFKEVSYLCDKADISSFSVDTSKKFKNPVCWVRFKDGSQELVAESCVEFNRRFNGSAD